MSTRCQVNVKAEGLNWETEGVTLYHHCDGYPSNMLPLIAEAMSIGSSWQLGRPRKAASFLCASDPGQFEPEAGHDLHGDIEFFYQIWCVNPKGGTINDDCTWEVQVFVPIKGFWGAPDMEHLHPITERMSVSLAAEQAEEIEKAAWPDEEEE